MISKELLSAVLDLHITNVSEPERDSNYMAYTCIENSAWDWINIYELAHKCKQYMLTKGYSLKSWIINPRHSETQEAYCEIDPEPEDFLYCTRKIETEPEAVFVAAMDLYIKEIK